MREYFYALFFDIYNKSLDVIRIESLLIEFYILIKDEFDFDETEVLSFSIIENDLSLRKDDLPSQLTEKDVLEFITGRHAIK